MIPSMQSTTTRNPRILAIDLRPQQFGYAVFEGTERLLDWGATYFRPGGTIGAVAAGKRVAVLVRVFLPSVIVVKKVRRNMTSNSPGVQPILKAIRHEASARSIPVCFIARADVREAFREFRSKSKYEIACILTGMFPELLWRLPPKRKNYQSEHTSMTIFDAVALGFTYWKSNGTEIPPPE
jgi:hypothetical protein